jgi:hypothetical protein
MDARSVTKLITILFLFSFTITAYSQVPVLKREVSMSLDNTSLERILIILANEADFNFSYNSQIITVDTLVSIHVENSTVKDVLNVILDHETTYKVMGNHLILIKEIPKSEKDKKNIKYEIKGYILDSKTGKALVNVSVYDPSGLVAALSDNMGYYNLIVTSKYEQLNLFYSKKNFYDTLIIVSPSDQSIDIQLSRQYPDYDVPPIESIQPVSYQPVEGVGIVRKFVSEQQRLQAENIDLVETRFGQVSIWPNVGTNLKMSGQVENKISLNILAGYSAGVKGVEIGGFVNIDRMHVSGLQLAGLGNVVGGTTTGAQIAGIFNNNRQNVKGLQLAGISNVILDTIKGAQVAGISNVLRGSMHGWQLAGISNYTSESVDGVQIAGISNIAKKDVDVLQVAGIFNIGKNVNGFQVAGIINTSRGNVGGWQIAGITNYSKTVRLSQLSGIGNISAQRVKGAQIAGLFNYSKYVDGGQFGLINIADSVGGIPIGFISIVRKGYHKVELSAEEVLYANITYKIGVRRFYNIFTAGVQPGSDGPIWGFGYGFGSQIGTRRAVVSLDLKGTQIIENVDNQAFNVSFRFSPVVGIRIVKRLSFFIGPALNLHVSDLKDPDTGEFITNIAPEKTLIWEDVPNENTLFQLWGGGTFGLRIL